MMVVRPDHESSRVPFRFESDFHPCAEDIVICRPKQEHGRCVVNCAIKWINEPIGLLARTDREFAMLDVPAERSVSPGEITGHTMDSRLLRDRCSWKGKDQNQAAHSCLKAIHA